MPKLLGIGYGAIPGFIERAQKVSLLGYGDYQFDGADERDYTPYDLGSSGPGAACPPGHHFDSFSQHCLVSSPGKTVSDAITAAQEVAAPPADGPPPVSCMIGFVFDPVSGECIADCSQIDDPNLPPDVAALLLDAGCVKKMDCDLVSTDAAHCQPGAKVGIALAVAGIAVGWLLLRRSAPGASTDFDGSTL